MTRRRFFAPPGDFSTHSNARRVTLGAEETRHLRDVLRLKTGDEIFIFDGEGGEYLCVLPASDGDVHGVSRRNGSTTLVVREQVEPSSPESPLRLSLGVALLKGEKFDLVVQKSTELGARRIIPIITKRADVRIRDAEGDTTGRTKRWQRLAIEAAKQCGRAFVPIFDPPQGLAGFVATEPKRDADTVCLMFAEKGGQSLDLAIEAGKDRRPGLITGLVGPEGGWEASEIEAARDAGWKVVTLGGRILRAETAAITVAALLQHRFGDLN